MPPRKTNTDANGNSNTDAKNKDEKFGNNNTDAKNTDDKNGHIVTFEITGIKRSADDINTIVNNTNVGTTYYSYEMKNGLDDTHVEGENDSQAFLKEYIDVIAKTHVFHSKDEWLLHQAKRAKVTANSRRTSTNAASNYAAPGSDEANARLIVESISSTTTRSVDRIEAFYKTTSHSTKTVLILRFLNQHNNDAWIWKPSWMIDIICNFAARVQPPEDSVLREAFANLTYGKQSDDKCSDKEKVKTIVYKPPSSSQTYDIEFHTAYTYITLPHEEFNTVEDETFWIIAKTTIFLETIRKIMASHTFRLSAFMIKEDFAHKLYDDKKRSTLPKFLSSTVIRVSPVVSLTDHLIQSTANNITGHLYNSRLPNKKYVTPCNTVTDNPIHID